MLISIRNKHRREGLMQRVRIEHGSSQICFHRCSDHLGDTVYLTIPGRSESDPLRILCLVAPRYAAIRQAVRDFFGSKPQADHLLRTLAYLPDPDGATEVIAVSIADQLLAAATPQDKEVIQ